MKTTTKLFLSALILSQFTALADPVVNPVFEYDWVGGRAGFAGKIFFDAPSSTGAPHGGNDADVLPGSFVQTPLGVFSILNLGLDAAFGAPGSSASWDATHIGFMTLFFDSPIPINNPAYGQPAIGNAVVNPFSGPANAVQVGSLVGGFGTAFFEDDFTGQWLAAPVPEPSAIAVLSLGAGAILTRRRQRRA